MKKVFRAKLNTEKKSTVDESLHEFLPKTEQNAWHSRANLENDRSITALCC